MHKNRLNKAALAFVGAAVVVAGTAISTPKAEAMIAGHMVTATATWGGANCITIQGPNVPMTKVVTATSCAQQAFYSDWTYPHMWYGYNPEMGNAAWVSCQTYFDGILVDAQYATAGDGTEVDCIGVM